MLRITVRDLDRLVTFQTLTKSADGAGGFTETWTDTASIWAGIRAKNGREQNQQGVWVNKIGYEMVCRFEDFTPGINMRVKYTINGTVGTYQVDGPYELDDERKFYIVPLIITKNG